MLLSFGKKMRPSYAQAIKNSRSAKSASDPFGNHDPVHLISNFDECPGSLKDHVKQFERYLLYFSSHILDESMIKAVRDAAILCRKALNILRGVTWWTWSLAER